MTEEEAGVIAHLAERQPGVKTQIRCEGATWIVLARHGDAVERIVTGTQYVSWCTQFVPPASPSEKRRARALAILHGFGWLAGGLLTFVTEAIGALAAQDKPRSEAVRDMDSAYIQEYEHGYGYRATHRPDARR